MVLRVGDEAAQRVNGVLAPLVNQSHTLNGADTRVSSGAQEATNGPRTGGRRLDQSERKVNGRRGDASVVAAPGKLGKRRHTPLPARAHLEALRGRALRATHRLAGM